MTQPNDERSGAQHSTLLELARATVPATDLCNRITEVVDTILRRLCGQKHNRLRHCDPKEDALCPCLPNEAGAETRCIDVRFPEIRPCISMAWGDSDCDCMETDDTEVLCITVCNCYSNVTFRDLTIGFVLVTDDNGGAVPTLPDGTPSVQVIPLGPVCFGGIGPCRDGRGTCVSREVVLRTRGARPGDYRIILGGICFSVCHEYTSLDCFNLTLCQD